MVGAKIVCGAQSITLLPSNRGCWLADVESSGSYLITGNKFRLDGPGRSGTGRTNAIILRSCV